MKSTTDNVEGSQPQAKDYLCEDKLEAENNTRVHSCPATLEKEGDGAKVGEGNQSVITRERKAEENLLERILSPDNLNAAYNQVKRNKGSHGVDGMTVEQLYPYLCMHGKEL